MNIVLCDLPDRRSDLLPLAYTRPIADFRVGMTTVRERWEACLPGEYSYMTVDYLAPIYPLVSAPDSIYIGGNVIPGRELCDALMSLPSGKALYSGEDFVAYRGGESDFRQKFMGDKIECDDSVKEMVAFHVDMIRYAFDVFLLNGKLLEEDYRRIISGRKSAPLSESNTLIGPATLPDGTPSVFLEEGASVEGAIINVKGGPVYVGKDAEIMEGCCIRGALALLDHSKLNMGAKVYGATTIGPHCKVGGEVNNAVFFGYSNKAHDGFVGNAVIGEWCNLGAGVNASNLKNDYTKVRVWNYTRHTFMRTDLQFCGLIMGDHSKLGINCMLNTATVVGVGVNLHGSGFPRTFLPSFIEGSPVGGFRDVSLSKFFEIASRVMARRDRQLGHDEEVMFERIFEQASRYKQ